MRLLVLLVLAGCGWDFNRMNDQARCEPGDRTPWLPDQRCDQLPPPNTIAWRAPPQQLAEPAPTRDSIIRGKDRFARFCAPCHGTLGDGQSAIARDMTLRPPRSLHEPKVLEQPDQDVFRTITSGYGMMPGYAFQLSEPDRWAVVHYVRVLERSQAVPLARLPARYREEAQPWLK